MNILNKVLIKLGLGFLCGTGFMIGVVVFTSVGTKYIDYQLRSEQTEFEESLEEASPIDSERRNYDESANLVILDLKERISTTEFTILGAIENRGNVSWSTIKLKADLYDKEAEFIEQCQAYVLQTLAPQASTNFKLSCKSSENFSMNGYDNYKLSIADAHFSDNS